MTDRAVPISHFLSARAHARLRRRQVVERGFRALGIISIVTGLVIVLGLIGSIVAKGLPAFVATELALEVHFDPALIDPEATRDPAAIAAGNYRSAFSEAAQRMFPDATERTARREISRMFSVAAADTIREIAVADPSVVGTTRLVWLKASGDIDSLAKGHIDRTLPERNRRVSDAQLASYDALQAAGQVRTVFNATFFTAGDSREPELAGILGAAVGSALMLLVTLAVAFPLAVMAAVYLEEFAAKNRWTELIEININNLAAVPSIVFGLLGLAVLLNFFGMPRSAPLVGGLVLALMTLPTIIIAGRAALKAVPPSIREGALAMGASPLQTILHHVLPLAMPGMLTGTIIGMAQALGETAPLLLIGMRAFIVDIPTGFTDSATALPVQVFLFADAPERAFVEKTSAAIVVLLVFLIAMNLAAVWLRRRAERRW